VSWAERSLIPETFTVQVPDSFVSVEENEDDHPMGRTSRPHVDDTNDEDSG
jgi:hypothetical protein